MRTQRETFLSLNNLYLFTDGNKESAEIAVYFFPTKPNQYLFLSFIIFKRKNEKLTQRTVIQFLKIDV